MERNELGELHYIAPIANVLSILNLGILSHNRAGRVIHDSVAMQLVQERRDLSAVPGGRPLHDYVNLYIHARNPMMSKRRSQHERLSVVRLAPSVLDLQGAVITDGNAASDYTRFAAGSGGLRIVDSELAFAEFWTDPVEIEYFKKKRARCAEVLIPDNVPARFIAGFYVSGPIGLDQLSQRLGHREPEFDLVVDAHMFFQ